MSCVISMQVYHCACNFCVPPMQYMYLLPSACNTTFVFDSDPWDEYKRHRPMTCTCCILYQRIYPSLLWPIHLHL